MNIVLKVKANQLHNEIYFYKIPKIEPVFSLSIFNSLNYFQVYCCKISAFRKILIILGFLHVTMKIKYLIAHIET